VDDAPGGSGQTSNGADVMRSTSAIVGVDVRCESVVYIYPMPDGDVVALRGVDLDIEAGESVAILGPSGSGKSTLLSLLAGLVKPSAGLVRVGSYDVSQMSRQQLMEFRGATVSLVLQSASLNLLPYATVLENVQFAQSGVGQYRDRTLPSPTELLAGLRLSRMAHQPVATLSGGDQRLIALAMGMATMPRMLLVDEPTSELDPESRDRVMAMLFEINQDFGATLVIVTHDPAIAVVIPRSVTIRDGRVGTEGRRGEEFVVIGRDGTLQLPPEVLQSLPPGTLLRLRAHSTGVDLRKPDSPQ
jgi:ABC-type lipoprotein export system ATPase subunit